MNEVLAVINYCYYEQNSIISKKYHESDLFFSFPNIMVEMRDGFFREIEKVKNGIQERIKTFADIMKVFELHAYHNIENNCSKVSRQDN